jgi:co-chaperonin GroES (HSP10)
MGIVATRKLADIAAKIGLGGDPRRTLIDSIGQKIIDQFEPSYDEVLVATFVAGDRTKGGIIIGGDRTRAEDRFQGKVGLVLKCGHCVNTEKYPGPFPTPIKTGDWIMYRASDADEFFFVDKKTGLDGNSVRIIEQRLIRGRVQNPEAIY